MQAPPRRRFTEREEEERSDIGRATIEGEEVSDEKTREGKKK